MSNEGRYNFSSAQVRSRSFRCERLHIPDLTWRQRSHNRSYATNCPNFNLDAIVCEPSYEIKDFGLGHEQASPYRPPVTPVLLNRIFLYRDQNLHPNTKKPNKKRPSGQ